MPSFDTPDPIAATIDVPHGDVRISAGDRATTVVKVEPGDASDADDRRAAEQTRVEYANRQLLIKAPKVRSWLPKSGGAAINVTIELPAGSSVHGSAALADFRCDGPLGDCRIKTSMGGIRVDRADRPNLHAGIGDITV